MNSSDEPKLKIYKELGFAYFKLGNFLESEKNLEIALELSPDDIDVNITLGDINFINKNTKKYESFYNKCYKIAPDDARVLTRQAFISYSKNSKDDAFEKILSALDKDIDNIKGLELLQTLCYDLGKFEILDTYLQKYLTIFPNDAHIYFAMAASMYMQDKLDKALEYIENTLSCSSNFDKAIELKNIILEKNKVLETINS